MGYAIILLLVLLFTLPMMSLVSENTIHFESSPIRYVPSTDTPKLNLSYTSRTNLIDTPVKSGDTIAGDHIVLKAEWTHSLVNHSRLEINAHAIPAVLSLEENQSTLEIDTRALGNNASCTITSTAWLVNGTPIVVEFTNVYIGNFFVPSVKVTAPNGGEDWTATHNITWTASDVNTDDNLLFDVLASSDSGSSFETLISSTNRTWFEWDCTSLYRLDTYLICVRVTDGIYYNSDSSNSTFTAGLIVTTSTTTPTISPTTTVTGLDPRITAFIVLLLLSSGIMALVVYYAARKWF
jgi:hypothetical protein